MVALDGDVTAQDYGPEPLDPPHADTTWGVVLAAVACVAGVICLGALGPTAAVAAAGAAGALAVGSRRRGAWWALVCVVLVVAGSARGAASWAGLAPDALGPHVGWVRLVDDPQPLGRTTRVIVDVEGERFEMWLRRTGQRARADAWRAGDLVEVSGARAALDVDRGKRVAWQHVVGEFRPDWIGDVRPGSPIARASNHVRAAIERAGDGLPGDDGALFRGLVVGDDRDQPWAMLERFRRSGLSHLTAVSGQNVSFVLAAAGPLLRRCRPLLRWSVTLALIAWFVALTRFEPSILRAGVMAALSATAYATGRDRGPTRILAVAVTALVLIDPLLVWSVGFWLSVGATAGVSAVGPWLADRFARFDRTGLFALPLGVTLGAQIGVVVPSVVVFGRLPLVSVPANLLAVPVAGAVMLYGLPAGLIAGWIPAVAPVAMFPARLGVRWVDTVASIAARVEPDPPAQFVGWFVLAIAITGVIVRSRRRESLTDPPE